MVNCLDYFWWIIACCWHIWCQFIYPSRSFLSCCWLNGLRLMRNDGFNPLLLWSCVRIGTRIELKSFDKQTFGYYHDWNWPISVEYVLAQVFSPPILLAICGNLANLVFQNVRLGEIKISLIFVSSKNAPYLNLISTKLVISDTNYTNSPYTYSKLSYKL